jgi:uncharacterized protein YtpQ (UPF0354 family)
MFVPLVSYSTAILADSLADRVVASFNHESPRLHATIKSDDEIDLEAPTGSISLFLDRVRAECRRRPDDCDSVIKGFVQSITATAFQPDSLRFNVEDVYPVIRPASTVDATQYPFDDNVTRVFISRPYISGAVLLYAIDTPKALRFVSASDLEHAGLTVDALDRIAVAHVSRLPSVKIEALPEAPGLWAALAIDGYGTSRLFNPKFWDAIEARAGGPVAIALPTRDWLFAARLDDSQAIARLRILAARIVAGEPTAVTSALVRRDGQSWSEIPP